MPARRSRTRNAAGAQPAAQLPAHDGSPARRNQFPIVALGASAGGLEAIGRFLDALPPDTGIAFVVVQHLDPQHESMMASLLARHTRLAVQQASDRLKLQPGHIFLIPPGTYLSIEAERLRISEPRERHGSRLPFDFLLHSLAREAGQRAMGVVLSGTGADGTKGLTELRAQGGFAIAQDPEEAAFDGMPRSAIDAGAVDLVLPVADIPAALVHRAREQAASAPATHDLAAPLFKAASPTDAATELPAILALLQTRSAHRFSLYKQGTLQRRIERRMGMLGITDAARYLARLRDDADELESLAKDLLITVTRFFRDTKTFDLLASKIVPELVAAHAPDQPLRVWVAGCSTGEEVYSIAMLFLEALSAKHSIKLQIFGSDIDEDAVIHAREGTYPKSIEADVSAARLARFFIKDEGAYRVLPELRAMVVFTVQDLLTDPPFSRLDLISCRNLLIYLQPKAQEKVLLLFHFALREGGILLLGGSEAVGSLDGRFTPVSKLHRIYRQIGHGRPGEVSLPIGGGGNSPRALWLTSRRGSTQRIPGLAEQAQRMLLDSFAPASAVIDSSFNALHFSGPVDRYLRIASGEPSRNLLGLARDELRSKLREAVQQANETKARVELGGARMKRGEAAAEVRIVVQPMPAGGAGAAADAREALLLVSFFESPARPQAATPPADFSRVAELERELEATRRELDSAVRDLQLANEEQKAIDEEAMSINEEFQSANEELVTSKEELHSLNEELTALNSQLQETLERQRNTSNDLKNILDSAGVATLFLDRDLNIRFFTPAMTALFKIIPGDIGRPLSDLSTLAAGQDLARDAYAVLAGAAPIQQQIETADGVWMMRGILPYRTQEGRVEGAIVTFSDITSAMLARREVEAARSYSESIINTIRKPLVVLDAQYRIVSGNRAFFADFDLDPVTSIGKGLSLGTDRRSELPGLRDFLDRANRENAPAADYATGIDLPRRGARLLDLHARCIDGNPPGERKILLVIDDVTEQKRAAEALQSARVAADRANLGKSRFLASASHDLRQPLQTIRLLRDLLEKKVADPGAVELLSRLDDAVKTMADILNTLLDINEIESGVVRPNISSFPISGLLERLEAEFGYHAQALALGWRVVQSSVAVRSDPRLLEQMIRNLLTNALKYTGKHSSRTARGRVLLGCRRRGGKLLIQVWDNGPGIPREQLGAIFEEFYQVGNPARERRNGLGLGLSIVKRLADLLGHTVRGESRMGEGSVFTIELPIAQQRPATQPTPNEAQRSDAAPASTILVVEDDPVTRELLGMVLAGTGYAVAGAADGVIATDMVARGVVRPDAVVADFNLPNGANGVQTVANLRQRLGADLPAVVLTGDITGSTLREISTSFCRHLAKPVDSNELLNTIHQLLATAKSAPDPVPPTPVSRTGTDWVVHVIDDDPVLAETIRELLTAADYRVRVYGSCEAFLETNPGERNGCLLLDERLPGITGLDLLRLLQAEGRGPPAIMMTGYGDVKMAVAAMQAGAVNFIEKPATPADLLAAVSRALDEHEDIAKRAASRQQASSLISGLTQRQREIMERVLAGQPSKNIAADLNISQRTVENHRAIIMKKTGARSIPELVRVALGAS